MSPELIKGEGAGFESDWWTFGVLLYEISVGITPFTTKTDSNELFNKIINCEYEKKYMSHLSNSLYDLICRLLVVNPKERLSNAAEIMNHAFFKGIDFNLILSKKIQPPFIPRLKSNDDTKYFDNNFIQMDPTDSCKSEDMVNSKEDPFMCSPFLFIKKAKSRNKLEEFTLLEEVETHYRSEQSEKSIKSIK